MSRMQDLSNTVNPPLCCLLVLWFLNLLVSLISHLFTVSLTLCLHFKSHSGKKKTGSHAGMWREKQ